MKSFLVLHTVAPSVERISIWRRTFGQNDKQVDNKVDVQTARHKNDPSSGYGRRLMLQRLWVQIPAPCTGWTFYHIYSEQNGVSEQSQLIP